ncbi:MAG: ABC transporter ATP-binding protein [Hespellia sp.]|nr:ABC transporter ATP-binding protein [Hespellia sp.]
MVDMNNIEKVYTKFHLKCNLQVKENGITGLIGQNGAGKSTTFKAILNLISVDAGAIQVFGKDYKNLSRDDRENIGIVLSESGFSNYLCINDVVKIMKSTYRRFDEAGFIQRCEKFRLPMKDKIKTFSTGMKAKLKILVAISHDADLLILDEPTAGLDVVARDGILDILREYMLVENRGILISSHIATDLEGLCDDIYLIDDGNIILHEDTDVLLNEYGLIKAGEDTYKNLDKRHILSIKKESYGYSCLTNQKQFYMENYPDTVIEKTGIDEVIYMTVKGEKL